MNYLPGRLENGTSLCYCILSCKVSTSTKDATGDNLEMLKDILEEFCELNGVFKKNVS